MTSQTRLRIGLFGYGSIGTRVVGLLAGDEAIEVVGALVRDTRRQRPGTPRVMASVDDLIAARPDIVVEAAGHAGLREHGPRVLEAGIDLLAVSVGALADPATERAILDSARIGHSQVTIASGAIGALDALASAQVGGLTRVTHITRKPPRSLMDAAEADALREPRELFRGSAREGALKFPESINVAAAVSLAGLGFDATEVCVVADPAVSRNMHQVVAEGTFGALRFEIQNVPSADNPRTAGLVAMSIVHCLRRRHARLIVG